MRRREMAIRAALGAGAAANVRMVVADAARPIVIGLAAGLAGAVAAAPALRSVLFDVDPLAPVPLAGVAGLLLAAGIAAAVIAAQPIRRVDPIDALRFE
jgi:ABC-type antimicrobial peptide transport system permease subunit